jgi:hypothetical protein
MTIWKTRKKTGKLQENAVTQPTKQVQPLLRERR